MIQKLNRILVPRLLSRLVGPYTVRTYVRTCFSLTNTFGGHGIAAAAAATGALVWRGEQVGQFHFFTSLGLRPGSLYVDGKMMDLEGPTFNAFQVKKHWRNKKEGKKETKNNRRVARIAALCWSLQQ